MGIRKGVQADMKSVYSLIQELAVFEKEPNAVVITEQDLILDGFGNKPLFEVFVFEEDNEIQGIALYYYRYSTWKGKTIHLEDLIVREHKRSSGIGRQLFTEVLKQANSEGLRRVEWNVLRWNTNAIDFYKKAGASICTDWLVAQIEEENINVFLKKNNP